MSWGDALAHALRRAEETGRHWYVYGYRTSLGEWRYGAYRCHRFVLEDRWGWRRRYGT